MHSEQPHITEYKVYGWVLLVLLVLTTVTITVTWIDLAAWTVAVALLIATVKVAIVLTYFMHLKFDNSLFRIFVFMVLLIYVLVILLTFFDYAFRNPMEV
jgi:cytochrome c oxidase subunit 4